MLASQMSEIDQSSNEIFELRNVLLTIFRIQRQVASHVKNRCFELE